MKSNPSAKEMVQIDLLRRTSGGDNAAFRKLYDLSSPQVYSYLMNLLQVRSIVETTLVETYQTVWKTAKTYKPTLKVSIWILGIARTIAKQKLSQEQIKNTIKNQVDNEFKQSISDTLVDQETLQREALRNLDPYHREILGLILMPHTTYPDLAKLLNTPLQKVKQDVFAAKAAYRKNLAMDIVK